MLVCSAKVLEPAAEEPAEEAPVEPTPSKAKKVPRYVKEALLELEQEKKQKEQQLAVKQQKQLQAKKPGNQAAKGSVNKTENSKGRKKGKKAKAAA